MHDIRAIRANPAAFANAMSRRGLSVNVDDWLALDASRRDAETALQSMQATRNATARQIADARRQGLDSTALETQGASLRAEMEALQAQAARCQAQLTGLLETYPNVLDSAVPDGQDASSNVVVHQQGEIPRFEFTPRQHFELGEAMGEMDFRTASKLSGARFSMLRLTSTMLGVGAARALMAVRPKETKVLNFIVSK